VTLVLPTHWVWDFWLVDTASEYHMFFLRAPREVAAADRHWNVSIGHAVSTDLTHWQVVADALVPSPEPAFDDYTTWTGSVVRADDGTWCLFYTGLSRRERGQVQRVGLATSTDLMTWRRHGSGPLVSSDPRWYHQWTGSGDVEAWRDPWVLRDPDGDGWHMLVTATGRTGAPDQRGVLGHAWSADLLSWQVRPPLSEPSSGYAQLEVPTLAVVEGAPVLLFNCLGPQLSHERRRRGDRGGVWMVRPRSLLGPYEVREAVRLTDESLYVGRLVQDRAGRWVLLAFVNEDRDGAFVGSVSDPIPVPLPLGSGPLLTVADQVP